MRATFGWTEASMAEQTISSLARLATRTCGGQTWKTVSGGSPIFVRSVTLISQLTPSETIRRRTLVLSSWIMTTRSRGLLMMLIGTLLGWTGRGVFPNRCVTFWPLSDTQNPVGSKKRGSGFFFGIRHPHQQKYLHRFPRTPTHPESDRRSRRAEPLPNRRRWHYTLKYQRSIFMIRPHFVTCKVARVLTECYLLFKNHRSKATSSTRIGSHKPLLEKFPPTLARNTSDVPQRLPRENHLT